MRFLITSFLVTSTMASGLLTALAMGQPRYAITDLGPLPGGKFSQATFLNDNRLAAGIVSDASGTQYAALWGGPLRINLGTPGLNSGAFGANNSGQVSIQTETSAKDPNGENFCAYGTGLTCVAAIWQRGVLTVLPTLGGNNSTVGVINNKGEIVGLAENATRDAACSHAVSVSGTGPQLLDFQAVIWGPKQGDIRELHPLPGDTVGLALGINDSGQAVGASGTCANTGLPPLAYGPHAVLWEKDGSAHDLGNLGAAYQNIALFINNPGQVVGASTLTQQSTPGSGTFAFLWTKEAGMRNLGALPGDTASGGVGINDNGQVIGPSFDAKGNPRAFLWQNGVMSDLNDLVVGGARLYLLFATAINARGEIAGFGATEEGDVHGFLATPVSSGGRESRAPAVQTSSESVRELPPAVRRR